MRPGSPDRSRMSGSGGALGGGQGDPRAATSTRPPRARPARGPEGRRPGAPSRGRGALPRGSAAADCPARARAPLNSGLVSESPCPGDLVKPRAGEPRGLWPSLPPPRDCYSGRRAQGRGMCANRGRPAPVPRVRVPASSPPTRRWRPRDGSLPGSPALPSRSAPPGPRPLQVRSGGSRSTPWPPQVQGPQRTEEKLSPRGWARGAGSPLPAGAFPGAAVTAGRTPPRLPPSLPGPRTMSDGFGARPGSRGPHSAWPCPYPLRPQLSHSGKGGTATLSAGRQLLARTGEVRVTPGLPPPHPFQRAAFPRPPARSRRPLPAPPPAPHCHPRCSVVGRLRKWGTKGVLCPQAPARLSLRASSSWKPTVGLPALTTGREGLRVYTPAWSSSKQSHPMPLVSSIFIENLLRANTLGNQPASQASEGGRRRVGLILP